jgi:hypothetical protein
MIIALKVTSSNFGGLLIVTASSHGIWSQVLANIYVEQSPGWQMEVKQIIATATSCVHSHSLACEDETIVGVGCGLI